MSKRIYNLVDLNKFQREFGEWADTVFGRSRGAIGPLNHLKKELVELETALKFVQDIADNDEITSDGRQIADAEVLEEYADCFLLLINSAFIQGIDMRTLMQAAAEKFEVCKNREWGPVNADGFAEHIREEE